MPYKCHPRSGWFPKPVAIAGPLFEPNGSATFIPISRIKSRCAVVYNKNIKFDYGEDSVVVVVPFIVHEPKNYADNPKSKSNK